MLLQELADDAVDPSRRTPLHRQLSTAIRSRITDGSLPAGTPLPTEAELQHRFGISRSVVRQALRALNDEGLIERSRGRGSVVAPHGEHHRLVQRVSGLSAQLSNVTTRVLFVGPAVGPEKEPRAEIALGTPDVLALRRVRSADGEPIALIHTWLPLAATSSLSSDELTDASLHATLRRRFGLAIVGGRRQVRAVAASLDQAESLRIAGGAPLLVLEGTSLDRSGNPVEFFRTWHRADRIVFDIDVVESAGPLHPSVSAAGEKTKVGATGLGPAGLRSAADRAFALAAELAGLADAADSAPSGLGRPGK